MTKIFVSYRRKDSEAITHRLVERLIARYGRESVFIDVDSIPYGEDVRDRINKVLDECDVCIVVIGLRWMGSSKRGGLNIHRGNDWVRLEVEEALRRNIRLIPVLVDNREMPRAEDLPDALKKLADINAASVGNRDFHTHVNRLIEAIDSSARPKSTKPGVPFSAPFQETVPTVPAVEVSDTVGAAHSDAGFYIPRSEPTVPESASGELGTSDHAATDGSTLRSGGSASEGLSPTVSNVRRAVLGLVVALAVMALVVWAATQKPVTANISEETLELGGTWCEVSLATDKTVRLASIYRGTEGKFGKRDGVFADGFYPYSKMLVERHGSDVVMGEGGSKVTYEYQQKPHEALVLRYLTQGGTADTKYYQRAPCP